MDPAIDMGTVIDEAAAKSFEEKVNDAITVDIDQLRPWMLEAAKKRQRVGSTGGV